MFKREEIDCCFLELVRRICHAGELGSCREEMRQTVEKLLDSADRATMHRDIPWLTDVFFCGILSGEAVQAKVRALMLAQWRKLACIGQLPVKEKAGTRISPVEKENWSEFSDVESVRKADRIVRSTPVANRAAAAARLRRGLESFSVRADADRKAVSMACYWLGKYGPLPLPDYQDWSDGQLDALASKMSAEAEALNRAESIPVDRKNELLAMQLRSQARDLKDARSHMAALKLTWLPQGERELLATEIDCLCLLHRLAFSVTYGLNRYGAGRIPPLQVGGRQAPDGGIIGFAANEDGNVNMVLDNLAMGAFLKLMGVREKDGHRMACFGPIRRYVEGPFTTDYLVGMVQNAVASLRCREVRGDKLGKISKEFISAKQPGKNGEEGLSLEETLPSPVETVDDNKDRAYFFRTVIGSLSPDLLRYFSLVHSGVPKGESRKRIGAKSTHFVEREIKLILKALDELRGEDFAELAQMLRDAMEKFV